MTGLKGKDILDGAQFTREEIDLIMRVADDFRDQLQAKPDHPALDLMRALCWRRCSLSHTHPALFEQPCTPGGSVIDLVG
jgi:hypothetical protein